MAGPVTHVIAPMVLLEVYRRCISKKKFSYWYVLLGGLFGALPDFDMVAGYAWSSLTGHHVWMHRMLSHTLLIPLLLLVIGLVFHFGYRNRWWKRKKRMTTTYTILFVAAFALTTHVLLDCVGGFYDLFWPFRTGCLCTDLFRTQYAAMTFDGFMLALWLLYDEKVFNPMLKWINKRLS